MKTVIIGASIIVGGSILGYIFTRLLIPFLKSYQLKQFVREEGPKSHLSKTGTPSMGGIAIGGAITITTIAIALLLKSFTVNLFIALITGLLFGLIGFIDDYQKAIKKNNAGISPKQKIVLQVGFALLFSIWAYFNSGSYMTWGNVAEATASSSVWIPIWNNYIHLGFLYIPWVVFIMVAFSNSVNLTDGLDGLASSVTTLVAFTMAAGAIFFGYMDYPIIMLALAGSCIGFLFFNHYPAKIFMGDTGSMMLGGILASTAVMMKMEIILAIAGLVYVFEALSVIIQVTYFKKTGGKRFFKMAPLHHHFELSGLHETRVVRLFLLVTAVVCGIAYVLVINS